MPSPSLEPVSFGALRVWTDPAALEAGVLVAFSERHGGVSEAPFHSLNLGARAGDSPEAVVENRRRVAEAVGFDASRLALTRQVHGVELMRATSGAGGILGEADGLVTDRKGVVLGILSADCAAVALLGAGGVALVHAGWRGLAGGIVERGVRAVEPVLAAWVGPAIGACCYEVGDEVVEAWNRRGLPVADSSHVDPRRAAVAELRTAGVTAVAALDECTACGGGFFSYRRDGVTGRHGAFISPL
ncbi:MAG: laccase domain-containing protein [Actinobacteria bacterium]|nr:laccase domain-containing protein [Actinomycetota bacterium]MDQ3531999.1 polyphenol oxidase family protein [Actinomycetota bacterium]